ncbi:MAG: peptidoglycan editing factor PgeF [Lachnospiraceae bacterium]|nr:peptidoglycan editing factor PgeF [Lachnospiraceae bacterium]
MDFEVKLKGNKRDTKINEANGVVYLTFPILEQFGVKHGFSTRLGGVSEGMFSSMNLSFQRGDDREKVEENYKRICNVLNMNHKNVVLSNQVHDTKIKLVTKEDAGKGMIKESDIIGIDGLITQEKDIPLVTFYADCVPLFFYDPVKEVIAAAHSGWRGTKEKIGKKVVETMEEEFGCKKEDVVAVIGPSICQDCYEVSEDVVLEFQEVFMEETSLYAKAKENGKYNLDLWKVNSMILKEAGILEKHMSLPNLCTCCNPKLLFSHRASKGKRGNLAGFISL